MVGTTVNVQRKSGFKAFSKRVSSLTKMSALVGIPNDATTRSATLRAMASKTTSKLRQAKLNKAAREATDDLSSAEVLFLLSKGSPGRSQPPRPVLEPAVSDPDNARKIGHEIAAADKAGLAGNRIEQLNRMRRAGLAGQNAARGWFTNPRNGWAPNAPSTIAAKGSDTPGIDTGATRAAITYVVRED